MKRLLFLMFGLFFLASCEDVIEVDLPKDDKRLSIDALIRLNTDLLSTQLKIRATETSSFFEDIGPANLDLVQITNALTNESIVLEENPKGSGIYVSSWSLDELLQGELILTMDYKNEQYEARTNFVPTVPFNGLKQGDGSLFSGDETEILVSYTDEASREDFYLFDFDFDEYLVSEDTFYPGQAFEFSYFYEDGLVSGQELNISILGVDEIFYNYMNQLIAQSGSDQGPFQTPSATVKGNIVNLTDPDRFALGFFAVCQTFSGTIIIE